MILTESSVTVLYDVLTALSRLHSKGELLVHLADIAKESGHTEHDAKIVLGDADSMEWARLQLNGCSYRLADKVVRVEDYIRYCDVCRYLEGGKEVRAVADAHTEGGRWANVCARHFAEYNCTLGSGRGQMLRLDY